ncbi:MAG TPA: hypothetical protein VGZ47_09260 [Gemmataceae bacterium]|jgi:hypothetical protein|nr:hypothetical protein [Gemmataceae bacterium]
MLRTSVACAALLALAIPAYADNNPVPNLPIPSSALKTALPYVQAIHQVLDSVTRRDSPTTVGVKKEAAEQRSEWIVHRVKASVWVERSSANYLGEIDVRVTIPCYLDYAFDLSQMKREDFRYDPVRKLLVIDMPQVYIRDPLPILSDMKIEPKYKGLRNVVFDTEAMQGLQATVLRQDYQPTAREVGQSELAAAQRRARDLLQDYLQGLFRQAGTDVEVIVR